MAKELDAPHTVLGVAPGATDGEVRAAFRRLAAEVHPDVNPAPEAAERFHAVRVAYDTLVAQPTAEPRTRKPRRKRAPRGAGSVFRRPRRPFWWVAFSHAGRRHEASSLSEEQRVALDLLKKCWTAVRDGTFVSVEALRDGTRPTSGVCLADLRDTVLEDARRNGLRSLRRKEQAYAALVRHLGEWTAVEEITKERIERYLVARLRDPVGRARDKEGKLKNQKTISGACVNRELDQLRLGFRLLDRTAPRYKKLPEADPRDRWPAPGEVERVIAHLPAHLQGPLSLLRVTGWRVREALGLTWSRVDRAAGTIRLAERDTKTRKPRTYPYAEFPELAALVEERWAATAAWQQEQGQAVPWVFWKADTVGGRPVARPVTLWSKAWASAAKKAKVSDLHPHDLRRGAARNLIRAGVDEAVAMKLLGHRTPSVFRRYNITADDDLRAGVRKLAVAAQEKHEDHPEAKEREA